MLLLLIILQSFSQDLYITEERATLWNPNDPGYTFEDCKNPSEYTYVTCERRIAWPAGGEKVSQTKAMQTVRGKNYLFVQIGSQYGWVEESTIDKVNKKTRSRAYMYTQAGLSPGRCTQARQLLNDCFFGCASQGKGEKEGTCINNCKPLDSEVKACGHLTTLETGTKFSSVAPTKFSNNGENFYFVNYS
ncbi:MAG: hypothetical protein KDD37_10165, partial [Bdellovibrionales bacterium]|nr:hypothetical protein [Bdellovibrionales bacterium]